MARLVTWGCETGALVLSLLEGVATAAAGAVTADTTVARSGKYAAKCDGAAGAIASIGLGTSTTVALGTTAFSRAYMYFTAYPASQIQIFATTSTLVSVRMAADGTLSLWNETGTPAQIGSSSVALELNKWHRIELALKIQASASDDYTELRLNGTSVASTTTASIGTTAPSNNRKMGWLASPGSGNKLVYIDDYALNDSSGAAQNTWPGEGKVVLLKPIADSNRVGWTAGAGATTNLWDAVNNTPPVGVAVASATDTSQIKDTVSNTTDHYDATLGAYDAPVSGGGGGISDRDTITLVAGIASHANSSTTSRNTGLQVLSNPVIAESVVATTVVGLGTWPTGWQTFYQTAISYAPSVTLGTSPVISIRKATATTDGVQVAFMGLLVEYVESPFVRSKPVLQAVGRATVI